MPPFSGGVVYDLSNMLLISKISLRSKDLENGYVVRPNSLVSTINLPATSIFSELSLYLNDTLAVHLTGTFPILQN